MLVTICFIFNYNTLQPRLGEIIANQLKSDLHYGDTLSLSLETKNINQPAFSWFATGGVFDNFIAPAVRWTAPDEAGTYVAT